jgi:hypothetical protein
VQEGSETEKQIVVGGDWATCSPEELVIRGFVRDFNDGKRTARYVQSLRLASNLLRDIREDSGLLVGRACVSFGGSFGWHDEDKGYFGISGTVTVGGLTASSLGGIAGILSGKPERAARDAATPLMSTVALKRWAREQVSLVKQQVKSPLERLNCASVLWRCGVEVGPLEICRFRGAWTTFDQLASEKVLPAEIYLVSPFAISKYPSLGEFSLANNVIETDFWGSMSILQSSRRASDWPDSLARPEFTGSFCHGNLAGAVLKALADAWGVALKTLLPSGENYSDREIGTFNGTAITEKVLVIGGRTGGLDKKTSKRKNPMGGAVRKKSGRNKK